MDGRSHDHASLVMALPIGLAVAYRFGLVEGIGAAIGCGMIGLFLEPDLDQEQTTFSEIRLRHAIGPLMYLWQFLWWAYASALPHRAALSHTPILATAIRVLYILIPFLVYAYIQHWDFSAWPAWAWPTLRGMFAGLCASDTAHWLMDFFPWPKRRMAEE
jgi:uncharacterized metal-binding protein